MMNNYGYGYDSMMGSYGGFSGAPFVAAFMLFGGLIALAAAAVQVWLFYRVFAKAGYNGWWGLLCLIPGIGLFVSLVVLAFDTWPIHRAAAAPVAAAPVAPAAPVAAPVAPAAPAEPAAEPPVPPTAS